MPDIKNYDKNEVENDLKRADAEKSGGINSQFNALNGISKSKRGEIDFKPRQAARKRLPLAVDIIVSILFVAIFAGAVVGAYYLFRYFSNDYENANVEYVIAVDSEEGVIDDALLHKNLYFDTEGSLEHFGKVKEIKKNETDGKIFITVTSAVRYKETEGYSIGEIKLAVGEDYRLRSENGVTVVGTMVELVDEERPLTVHDSRGAELSAEGGN